MMCPQCGETLLYRPGRTRSDGSTSPGGRTVWCPRQFKNLNGERVPCGYKTGAPAYFAAKNDPRQGQLL